MKTHISDLGVVMDRKTWETVAEAFVSQSQPNPTREKEEPHSKLHVIKKFLFNETY